MQGSDTLCTHRLLPSGESSITPSQLPQGQGATTTNAFASKKVITTNLANFSIDPPFSTFGNVCAIHESGQYLAYASKAMNKDQPFVRVLNTKSRVSSLPLLAGHDRVVDIAFAHLPSSPAGRAPTDADALPDFSTHFASLGLSTSAADKKTRTVPRLLLAATDLYGDLFLYELLEVTKPKPTIQEIFILRIRHRDATPSAPLEVDSSPERPSSDSSFRSAHSSTSLAAAGKLFANRRVVWSKFTTPPSAASEGSLPESGGNAADQEGCSYSDLVRYSLVLAHTDGAKCDVWDVHSFLREHRKELLESASALLPAQCKLAAQEQEKPANVPRPPRPPLKALLDLRYSSLPVPSATGEPIRVVRLRQHTDSITAAVFSPEGQLLATASLDGTVRYVNGPIFPNYFLASPADLDPSRIEEASGVHAKPPRKPLFVWKPHDGLPVHTLIFLEDYSKLASREVGVAWRYAITGTNYNHELKLWKTQGWQCIQLLRFMEPEPLDLSVSDPRTIIRVAVDNSAQLLVMSDMRRRVYYVAQIARFARNPSSPAALNGNGNGSGSPLAAAASEQEVPPEESPPAEEELWLATLSEFVLLDTPLAFSISTIKRSLLENVHDVLNVDGCDSEESEEQVELNLFACTPKNLQQQKISFSLPLNPPPPAFGASATPTVENLLQNPPPPESTAMAAAASDSISSQFSLLSSGPNLDRTSDSNLDPTSNASNKPILLNPGDFLAAGGGALDSAPPPAPLGDSSSVWTEREQSFGRAAEPVLFIGGAAQTESLDVSGSLAFGRLDSSAPNTPEQPAIGPLVSQAQSSEAVGAPIGFRSTAPGVGSAFHPYSSPGRRSNDAVLSSLVPVSLPPVSTSVPHASFMSLPQTAVSALKPSPYLTSTGHLELVQPQPPQLAPPLLPDTSSAEILFSKPTVTSSTTSTASVPSAPAAGVPSTTSTSSTLSGGTVTTQSSAASSFQFSTSTAPRMLPTSVFLKTVTNANASAKPGKPKAPKKKTSTSAGAHSTEEPVKEAAPGPEPDERKTATKHPRTPDVSVSSLGPGDLPEDSSALVKLSTRLERALQLLEAQQGTIGRLEQEVGSLRSALTFASTSAEPSLPNGANAVAGLAAQTSLALQLDTRFDELKKSLDKGLKQNEQSVLEAVSSRLSQSIGDRIRTSVTAAMQGTPQQRSSSASSGNANPNPAPSPDAIASAVTKTLEKTLQSRLLDAFKVELQNFQNSLQRDQQAALKDNLKREIIAALTSKETCDMFSKSIQDPIVKSVTEVHSKHLFPVVQGAVESILAKLSPRFEEGLKQHALAIQSASSQLPQLLIAAVRQVGREAMEQTAADVVAKEMRRVEAALGDAIKAQMQLLLEQLAKTRQQQNGAAGSGATALSAECETRLKEQVATALVPLQTLTRQLNDQLVNQLGTQLAAFLYNALSTQLSQTVSTSLQSFVTYLGSHLKSHEEVLANAVKGHVDAALRAQLQKPLESLSPDLQRQLVANNEALKTEMQALIAGFTPVLTKQVQETLLPRFQETLSQAVVPVLNECVQRAVRTALPPAGQLTSRPPSVMGARSSSPSRPMIDRDELLQSLRAGRVNHAFQVALYASDLSLVEWLCQQAAQLANHRVEHVLTGFQLPGRTESTGPLDFAIILSLAHQLAMSLTTSELKPSSIEMKLSYLQASMNLMVESAGSPAARQHAPVIIKQILQQCASLQQSLIAPAATSSPAGASAASVPSALPPTVARLLRQVVMSARGALEEFTGPLSPAALPSTNSSLVTTSATTLFS